MKIASIVIAMVIGFTMAVKSFEQPVGSVTNSFCGAPDKHCTTYSYEVN